jgi:hypothetical protein
VKTCTQCSEDKGITHFRRDRRTKDGRGAVCTDCNRKAGRIYREAHLDACNARMLKWKKENPKKYMLWRAKQHSRKRGHEFALTESDLPEFPVICPLLGLTLEYDARTNNPATASLDRIDSSKGYVAGNVQVISWRANQIKSNASPEEMRLIASRMQQSSLRPVLPTDADSRNKLPMADGLLDYFPLALAEISKVSFVGNLQHNPGQAMHWARLKSTDHANKILKHLIDRGTIDVDGLRHSAKVAWRALALLQEELESTGAPSSRASKW